MRFINRYTSFRDCTDDSFRAHRLLTRLIGTRDQRQDIVSKASSAFVCIEYLLPLSHRMWFTLSTFPVFSGLRKDSLLSLISNKKKKK